VLGLDRNQPRMSICKVLEYFGPFDLHVDDLARANINLYNCNTCLRLL
jgi:hypothetical protein